QIRIGAMRRPGRAILLALTFGALVLAAMSLALPFRGLLGLWLAWGLGAGVVITQGRRRGRAWRSRGAGRWCSTRLRRATARASSPCSSSGSWAARRWAPS